MINILFILLGMLIYDILKSYYVYNISRVIPAKYRALPYDIESLKNSIDDVRYHIALCEESNANIIIKEEHKVMLSKIANILNRGKISTLVDSALASKDYKILEDCYKIIKKHKCSIYKLDKQIKRHFISLNK